MKRFLIRAAPEQMENYDHAGNRIRVTTVSHENALMNGTWKGRPVVVNHDMSRASRAIGKVLGERVDEKGLWLEVGITDEDALRIMQAKLHKGWSIGFREKRVNPDGEVVSYKQDHFSLILPGQRAVFPHGEETPLDTFSRLPPLVDGFSFVESETMTNDQTNPAPAPVATAEPQAPAAAPAPAPEPAAPAPVAAEPAPAPAPAAAPAPAPAETKHASENCPHCGKSASEAPAPSTPAPEASAAPANFSEVDVFALREKLAEVEAARMKELAELEQLRNFKASLEAAEKQKLLATLKAPAGVDLAAKPLEDLRTMAAIIAANSPTTFSEQPPAASDAAPQDPPVQGSGAREHNKPPAVDPKEAKAQMERERIARLWKNVRA